MDNNLISYVGIDTVQTEDFIYTFDYKLEGTYLVQDSVDAVLAFSVNKSCIEYKTLNSFEEDTNIIVLKNKFDLSFEYGSKSDKFSLKMDSTTIFRANYVLIKDLDLLDINVTLQTKNLACILINENEIFYSMNLLIGIS